MFSILLTMAAIVTWQEPQPPPPAPRLFIKMPFDQARLQSQGTGKPILLYVTEADNPQCTAYTEFTWSDPRVRGWINARAIPLEIDLTADASLARQYHVRTAPTLLVVLPDGKTSREIVGFRGPELLLKLLEARLVDPVAAAKKVLDASGGDTSARVEYAKVLAAEGRHTEAMDQYLLCVDGPAVGTSGDLGGRLLAVEAFARLILVHPPAREALQERRDRLRESVAAGAASGQDTALYAYMNAQLGAVDDTLKLYQTLKESAPASMVTRMLRDGLAESLIATRRYADALTIIDPLKHFDFALEQHLADERRPTPAATPDRTGRFRNFLRDQFIERTVRHYEALLGAGRDADARSIADRMIGLHPTPKTYGVLAAASLHTGQAPAVALGQANKALELSDGAPTFELLTTLVRCLKAVGKDEEASAIVRAYADRIADAEQSEALRTMVLPRTEP